MGNRQPLIFCIRQIAGFRCELEIHSSYCAQNIGQITLFGCVIDRYGNRKNTTGDSASYSQNNPSEDHIEVNHDVKYDVNNSYESASYLCGDLDVNAAMGNNNNTTEDSAAKNPTEDTANQKLLQSSRTECKGGLREI